MPKITGGYYIKARKIQDSAIAKSPPHVREIWDWLLKTANHKDVKTYGVSIKRGQVFTSYAEIQEELSWKIGFVKKVYKKHHVDNAMAWLRQEVMITTQKTTRGLIVTICKYDYYQNPSNYDSVYDSDNEATRKRQDTSTINNNGKNDKEEKEEITIEDAKKHLEDMVVLEMMKIWKQYFPTYIEDKDKDYSACLQIAYKIAEVKKWRQQEVLNGKMQDTLKSWAKIVSFIKADSFYRKLTLETICSKWQGVHQTMEAAKQAEKEKTTGTDPTKIKIKV